jgi:NAD(P)-dependent dehydrogenase (short-subunit alcohol dehydrogenase family)
MKEDSSMARTILITGSSSGIGLETALLFEKSGWNVVATMREPEKRKTPLHDVPSTELRHLDVCDPASIREAISSAVATFGRIDAIVNNAGYAVMGVFEQSSREQTEAQFAANVIGLMDTCREIIPVFRKQGSGTIVNIASIGGRTAWPLYSIYNGSKWAVEGFSESLRFELEPLSIRVILIEPGTIKTEFYGRSPDVIGGEPPAEYADFARIASKNMEALGARGSHPSVVARAILKAVCSKSRRFRYATGANARLILALRRLLPDGLFHAIQRMSVLGQ